MFLDIQPRFQNSTFNYTNFISPIYYVCKDMRLYMHIFIWACVSLVCALCGFPACVAILWDLLQRHRRALRATPNDVFMLNLTVMDLVYLSFTPFAVCNDLFWYKYEIHMLHMAIYVFGTIGRPLFMTCICLDCYLAVVHPITYRARKSLTPRILMSIGVWVITVVYSLAHTMFYYRMMRHPASASPYVLTILTIGICDFFIFRALKSSDPGGQGLHPQKKRALQIIVNSLVMTVLVYLPPMLITSFCTLMSTETECSVLYGVYCSLNVGSAIMPVLHLSNLRKLDFIKRWCCKAQ